MPRRIYQWEEDVEDLEGYCYGGYHPVRLGDEFSESRYRIIHKLGYGAFSTVWLARDRLMNRYVSLKIVKAKHSQMNQEHKVGHRLLHGDPDHPGHPYVLTFLDHFSFDGPNGQHRCLVNEVVGPNIVTLQGATQSGLFPIDTARRLTAQLIHGLAYVHSCGIVHGGKFSP